MGDRVDSGEHLDSVPDMLPPGEGGWWYPVLLTTVVEAGLATGSLATSACSPCISSGFYCIFYSFTVFSWLLYVEVGVVTGLHTVSVHLGARVYTDSDRLGEAVCSLGQLDTEDAFQVALSRFTFTHQLSSACWVTWHQGFTYG